MGGKVWRAIKVLGWSLLLIGGGVSVVLACVDSDSFQVGFVVGFGWICGGIGGFVVGFDFIFRPGEPGPAEEYMWNQYKFVGATFAFLGGVLIFVGIAAYALAHLGKTPRTSRTLASGTLGFPAREDVMWTCQKCGENIDEAADVCRNCGTAVNWSPHGDLLHCPINLAC